MDKMKPTLWCSDIHCVQAMESDPVQAKGFISDQTSYKLCMCVWEWMCSVYERG